MADQIELDEIYFDFIVNSNYGVKAVTPVVKCPTVVIPAEAGNQKDTGCRIKLGFLTIRQRYGLSTSVDLAWALMASSLNHQ